MPENKNITILLIEDNEILLKLTRRILEKEQYHVIALANGEQLLHWLEQKNPWHLVVLDVNLPDMSAEALLPHIQSHQPQAKILLVSGVPSPWCDEACANPSIRFLQKPYDNKGFLKVVRMLLG